MKKAKLASVMSLAMGLSVASGASFARDFADIYTECGLGAMIAPTNSAVAAVTNVTWDLGTTAISSNISSPESCRGGQEKTAAFIHQGYQKLEMDIAKGDGDYLDQLISLIEVEDGDRQSVVSKIRRDLSAMVASDNYNSMTRYEKSQALYNIVAPLMS